MIFDYNYRMLSHSKEGIHLHHYPRTITHKIEGKGCASSMNRHRRPIVSSTAQEEVYHIQAAVFKSRSKSRQRKLSGGNLFAKAHFSNEIQTYLSPKRTADPGHCHQKGRSISRCCSHRCGQRSKKLQMHKQFEIIIDGPCQKNSISLLIENFSIYKIGQDLSCIQQKGEEASQISTSPSFLEFLANPVEANYFFSNFYVGVTTYDEEVIPVRLYKQAVKFTTKRRFLQRVNINHMKKRMPKSKVEKNEESVPRHKKWTHFFQMGPSKQVYLDKKRLEQVYLKDAVIVSFQPKRQSDDSSLQQQNTLTLNPQQKQVTEPISILPTFNRDSKYYTSAFLMPYDGEESDQQMKTYHQNKAKQSQRQINLNQILVPKPKSKHQFCAVCRIQYKDYLSHIQGIDHKKCIKRSKFNQDIQYLSVLIKEKYKPIDKDGVLTRSAKRKFDIVPYDYCELQMKTNKKRRLQGGVFAKIKKTKVSTQGQQNFPSQAATPFNKRWHMETTVKSINNGF